MFFDVHAHLTHEHFKKDLLEVVARAKDVVIHCAGSGLSDNKAVLDISGKHSNVKACLGLYPWDAVKFGEVGVDSCIDFIKRNAGRIVCVGEVGLDHYWGKAEKDWEFQEWVFERLLELAGEINRPVLVHSRKAERACLEMIGHHEVKVVIHSFTGPHKLIKDFLGLGCFFSIPSVVVRSSSFQELVRKLPIDRILTETDAPFLAPVIGQRSEPVHVKQGLKKIAELKGLTVKKTEKALTENYERLFS
jgi:TatD DNase family protein